MIGIFEFWTENDHDAVLQKVVELYGVRVETLTLQIMDPKERVGIIDATTSVAALQELTLSQIDRPGNR